MPQGTVTVEATHGRKDRVSGHRRAGCGQELRCAGALPSGVRRSRAPRGCVSVARKPREAVSMDAAASEAARLSMRLHIEGPAEHIMGSSLSLSR